MWVVLPETECNQQARNIIQTDTNLEFFENCDIDLEICGNCDIDLENFGNSNIFYDNCRVCNIDFDILEIAILILKISDNEEFTILWRRFS